jgi:protein subunit release factor B
MSKFSVSESKHRELTDKMLRLNVKESDMEESFVRSGGSGGQNVNKVSTCVILRHAQTGLIVKCQKTRSQSLNRYLARKILLKKIEDKRLGKLSEEARRISKLRRQKRKRSKRAKLKILEQKKHIGDKKKQRKKIHPHSALD